MKQPHIMFEAHVLHQLKHGTYVLLNVSLGLLCSIFSPDRVEGFGHTFGSD